MLIFASSSFCFMLLFLFLCSSLFMLHLYAHLFYDLFYTHLFYALIYLYSYFFLLLFFCSSLFMFLLFLCSSSSSLYASLPSFFMFLLAPLTFSCSSSSSLRSCSYFLRSSSSFLSSSPSFLMLPLAARSTATRSPEDQQISNQPKHARNSSVGHSPKTSASVRPHSACIPLALLYTCLFTVYTNPSFLVCFFGVMEFIIGV